MGKLDSQKAPGFLLSLSCQHWGYKCLPICLAFDMTSGSHTCPTSIFLHFSARATSLRSQYDFAQSSLACIREETKVNEILCLPSDKLILI